MTGTSGYYLVVLCSVVQSSNLHDAQCGEKTVREKVAGVSQLKLKKCLDVK